MFVSIVDIVDSDRLDLFLPGAGQSHASEHRLPGT